MLPNGSSLKRKGTIKVEILQCQGGKKKQWKAEKWG